MKKTIIGIIALSSLGFSGGDIAPVEPVVETQVEQEWEYGAEIYLWGASINGTSGNGSPMDIDFNDLLDNLRMGGMGAFSAQKDKWTLLADIIYLDVNEKNLGVVGPRGGELNSIGMKSWIIQPMASYAVYETDTDRFELLAGARYLYIKTPIGFNDVKITPSDDAWNGVIGVRGTHDFTDKWTGTYHLDIGTGDSDLTWQGIAGLAYNFEKYSVHAGYRYIDWDHNGEAIDDLNLGGVFAGVRFRF